MLERIQIQNFQVHDKLCVDFDPTITCVVGPTDAGKSSVLRALRWVVTNQPGGDAFVRCGSSGCTVRLFVDGHVVSRRRSLGGETNTYGLDSAVYKAFGRGVPEPVEALLNIGSVCWQQQHDAPYWFAETPGEVSRQLNSIVDLGIIDESLTNINQTFHRARTRLEVAKENLVSAKREADELVWVPLFAGAVDVLEEKKAAFDRKSNELAQVGELVKLVQSYQAALERATRANLCGKILVECGEKVVAAENTAERLRQLLKLVETARKVAEHIPPSFELLEVAAGEYRDVFTKFVALVAQIKSIKDMERELCRRKKALEESEAAIPEKCPTCGQYWSPTSTCKCDHL